MRLWRTKWAQQLIERPAAPIFPPSSIEGHPPHYLLLSFLRRLLIKTIFLALQLALVGGVAYATFEWLMRSLVHARPETAMPDLKGKSLNQAVNTLSRLGLAVAKESDEFAPTLPAGTVVKQYPLPATHVREGKIVRVVLSMGSEKITVPELEGLPLRKAEIELRTVGLTLGETSEVYSLRQPKSYVVDQDPKPMSLMEKGELVKLALSLGAPGPDKIIVPDFSGKNQDAASTWAKEYGVELRIIENWQPDSSTPDRAILSQSAAADSLWERDGAKSLRLLELTVARNPDAAAKGPNVLEYTLPAKPTRQREVVLKALTPGGERQIFRAMASPSEKVRIPLGQINQKTVSRARIYLDGVFTEERTIIPGK